MLAVGINGINPLRKMINRPIIPIVLEGSFNISDSIIKQKPIAPITSNINVLYWRSNQSAKFTTVNSIKSSHKPRVRRNFLVVGMPAVLLRYIEAETPVNNTKVGAHI